MSLKNCVLIALFIFASNGQARTLVISDIDDTIKVSNVLGNAVGNALVTNISFRGMSETYLQLAARADTYFFYVSNAPASLMRRSHEEFLKKGQFPAGELLLRSQFSKETHKIKTISALLSKYEPHQVILLGDNGERDIAIYDEIVKSYPGLPFITFIRVLYSPDKRREVLQVFPGQIGFVSPIEILLTLSAQGLLDRTDIQPLLRQISDEVVHEVETSDNQKVPAYFKTWIDCSAFEWDAFAYLPLLSQYADRVQKRCFN